MKALERDNRELRQVDEILREASAYLALAKQALREHQPIHRGGLIHHTRGSQMDPE